MAFYDFGVADPTLPEHIDRARRFAGLYLNEIPGVVNWDPQHRIIRGAATGSDGPAAHHYDAAYNLAHGHASLYPVIEDQEHIWEEEPSRRDELIRIYDEIVTPCDVPVNMAATGLMTHAFLLTGEEKYARWHRDIHDWTYRHFPDPEYGEWYGYLHRDGRVSVPLKGNLWKGPFHLPRMQLVCWKILAEMRGDG